MAPTKKVSSRSKSSSQSPKKTKMGSPMKKKLSQNNTSPKKSTTKVSDARNVTTTRHPNYQHMVTEAIKTLDSRTGSSRSKILNHIKVTHGIEGGKSSNNHLRAALEALLEESVISLAKGTGYSNGYYKIVSKGKKQNNKKSSSPSETNVHDKKASDKSRSPSKSGKQSKTEGKSRSRATSKIQPKSINKNKSPGRKSNQSTVSRSRSPIKKSKGDGQKSNQARQSRSRSLTKSRNSMTKQQQTEKPKSPQRGRPKVGQKRQALKAVNDNQKSVNKGKQTRSRSSKRQSTGNNHASSSPTKKARTSTGGRSKKGGK